MNNSINAFAKTVNSLPNAFEFSYWDMADTTYKEELVISFIEENKLKLNESKKLLKKCNMRVKSNPLVFLIIEGHIEQIMGMYVHKTEYGKRKLMKLRGF